MRAGWLSMTTEYSILCAFALFFISEAPLFGMWIFFKIPLPGCIRILTQLREKERQSWRLNYILPTVLTVMSRKLRGP